MTQMTNEEVTQKAMEILNKAYARRLTPDETGGYVASIHEFPGCIAEGDTADEAINNLDAVAASWVEVALANSYDIREPVTFHEYSGKIALRIPRSLHMQVTEMAELEGCSVNQTLVTAIAQYLGSNKALRNLSESIYLEVRNAMTDGLFSLYRSGPGEFVMSMPLTGRQNFLSSGTTIEGQVIAGKQFNLGHQIFNLQGA